MLGGKKCSDCKKLLSPNNWIKYNGYVRGRCKPCNRKHYREYNRKKIELRKQGEWF